MRLLHISDLHMTSADDPDREVIVGAFLKDIKERHEETPINLVLLSGDLAFSGKAEEYARATKDFLHPLMGVLGCDETRVVIAPGNHDIDRDQIDDVLEAGLTAKLKSIEDVNGLFDQEQRFGSYLGRLSAFNLFRDEFYSNRVDTIASGLGTAQVLDIDGTSIGVCALNTAWRATGGPNDMDHGNLLLGSRQVNAALAKIDSCAMRIAVMHHPVEWLAPFDGDEARLDLDRRFDLVLTGHLHRADPQQIASVRGTCVNSRAGTLYETARYLNAYSLIDIDTGDGTAVITIRSYWSNRREFDVATDLVGDGRFELPLKIGPERATLPAVRASYSLVRRSLVDVAAETSILTDQVTNGNDVHDVDDILVPPRLLPMPYAEWRAASEPDRGGIPVLDPIEVLGQSQCAVLVGGAETGLTSALLWVLDRHFDLESTRLPVHVKFGDIGPGADPLDRAIRKSLNRVVNLAPADKLPPLIVAIDDVDPTQAKRFRKLIGHIASDPGNKYLIGCRPQSHVSILAALTEEGVGAARAFLAPFGRRELMSLVEKIVGSRDKDLVDRVLSVLGQAHMPRTPFLMAALVVVLIEAEDFARGASTGETAVLDSYASLMLKTGGASSRVGLDEKNYQHILACLAAEFVTKGVGYIPRIDAEEFLVEYWKTKGWQDSPARVLESLIDRRVLSESEVGIRFRHPALLYLFAAKRISQSEAFRMFIEADPIANAVTFRHAAALDRSDLRLLELAATVLVDTLACLEGVDASLFDQVTFVEGWSFAPNLQVAARVLGLPAVPEEVVERQMNEFYDVLEDPTDDTEVTPSGSAEAALERLAEAVELLSNVLRASELVDDIELKTEMLRKAIDGWSVTAVAFAMEEARTNTARDLVATILEELFHDPDPERTKRRAEQITRVLLSLLIGLGALQSLGTVKMVDMLMTLLNEDIWVESTAHALFTTFIYFNVHGPERTKYLARLLQRHGDHPLVRELVRHTALHAYHRTDFGDDEATALENILVDGTLLDHPVEGVQAVSKARSLILGKLRKARQLSRGMQGVKPAAIDGPEGGTDDAKIPA